MKGWKERRNSKKKKVQQCSNFLTFLFRGLSQQESKSFFESDTMSRVFIVGRESSCFDRVMMVREQSQHERKEWIGTDKCLERTREKERKIHGPRET